MIIDVVNKTIVITGSSKGIGREIALKLLNEGANVIVNYYKSDPSTLNVFKGFPCHKLLLCKADITNEEEVLEMCNKISKKFGSIDVLINNAGIISDSPILEMTNDQWRSVLETNLTGMFICSKIVAKYMVNNQQGKIINIASLKGQSGSENQANYSTSKGGVISLTKSMAIELGKYNILVNALCPGFISTDMNKNIEFKSYAAQKASVLKYHDSLYDLINFVIFMVSDSFSSISGQVFNLDSRIKV
ncbi:SDR family NAD(P)-dependent oxidoreductase [Robertmurraya kyonggiensis]|uniref:SDR family NAD(P)-dependent oxidoreductase n=1 Tax=Robertmurraya kyonggiensis TaxID=1037680 RepID=UPI00130D8733|nr:SDR family NAD(P)-dependent oxidoreductase [Robertmurraya kyonggiensis]